MSNKKLSHAERGRKGGRTTAARHGQDHMRAIGRKGGQACVKKHGPEHMRQIGAVGFAATVGRHWNGDREAYKRRLVELGLMALDPMPENGVWQFPQREDEPW